MPDRAAATDSDPATGRALIPLLTVNMIGTLGFSLVLPFLVYIVDRFGGNEVIYGLLGATYSFFQLFGAPTLGRLSDRHGRRKILFITQAGTLLSWVVLLVSLLLPVTTIVEIDSPILGGFVLTVPLLFLFLARALDGTTGGNISVATAYVVDLSTDKTRARNMGRMALSTNLGFILGPMIAGLLGATVYGEKLPVLAAILISVIGLALIVFLLPESRPTPLKGPPCPSPTRRVLGAETRDCFDHRPQPRTIRDLLNIKNVPLMLGLYFFIFFAFNTYYGAFPMHAVKGLEWDTAELGFFFSFASAALIIVQGPVLGFLNQRVDSVVLFGAGALIMFFSFLAYSLPDDRAVYAGALLFAIGNGIMWPSFMAMLATLGPADQKGAIQGLAAGTGSLASILGLILGGLIYSQFQSATFIAAGFIFLPCVALAFYLPRTQPQANTSA
ncbi:MAG: MFS transporter [bacterium]|nr:MFS transporter [bacterium]